jgi:hypothetical protein
VFFASVLEKVEILRIVRITKIKAYTYPEENNPEENHEKPEN